jgi:hypothetical protein
VILRQPARSGAPRGYPGGRRSAANRAAPKSAPAPIRAGRHPCQRSRSWDPARAVASRSTARPGRSPPARHDGWKRRRQNFSVTPRRSWPVCRPLRHAVRYGRLRAERAGGVALPGGCPDSSESLVPVTRFRPVCEGPALQLLPFCPVWPTQQQRYCTASWSRTQIEALRGGLYNSVGDRRRSELYSGVA